MKPEEQQAAIAEACGKIYHTQEQHVVERKHTQGVGGFTVTLQYCKCGAHKFTEGHYWSFTDGDEVPNYLNDLNAMHEAEKSLPWDKKEIYRFTLKQHVATGLDIEDDIFNLLHATASQRAEAFLKTLGLWKD